MEKTKKRNYAFFHGPRTRTFHALNDTYALTTLTKIGLLQTKKTLKAQGGATTKFNVPLVSGEVLKMTRKKTKIYSLIGEAVKRDLYRQSLITTVAVTESYLSETLAAILRSHPQKLLTGTQQEGTKVDLRDVLAAGSLDDVISRQVRARVNAVFYASPDQYFDYMQRVFSFDIPGNLKDEYKEIKATRDILIHNSGVVNEVYLRKSGDQARAQLGETIPLDQAYFDRSITAMKRLIRHIYTNCLERYGEDEDIRGLD